MTFSNTPPDEAFLKTLSVLYVEDEEIVREEVARFLRRRFAQVDEAKNGAEGLELFEKNTYDIVITDIKMPVMDGLTMAEKIRAESDGMPIVIVTAFTDTDYFLKAIDLGVDGYVKKPINTSQLLSETYKATHSRFQEVQIAKAKNGTIKALTQIVGALSRAIEERDPYTNGHQHRVSIFAESIGIALGLSKDLLTSIRLGAIIHDIGKLSIPVELLVMPRKLTDIEYSLIKTHPKNGSDIVSGIDFPWPIVKTIHQHHERYDGSGYPDGLKGDEISIEARIVAVADVVEAMSSHRPYRPSLGLDAAIEDITKYRGIRYDPDVVDTAIRLLKEHGEKVFENVIESSTSQS
jgi:response regulator RpfG family c-di-GMP phosphodiesterase